MTHTTPGILEILFFGDLVGKPGRRAVRAYLKDLSPKPDLVIANVENVSHGFGLMEKHYHELREAGIQVMTSGNHIWDRKELMDYVHSADLLLRPANFPATNPGVGARIFHVGSVKVGVINLIGQAFMGNYNSPWEALDQWLPELLNETPVVFLDFHAETTAEKMAMARYAAPLGVSAMVGTHTHVQTADEQIMNGRMGYLTDAGFNGAYESVIGMLPEVSLERFRKNLPAKMEIADSDTVQVNAVRYQVEAATGICRKVERVREILQLK